MKLVVGLGNPGRRYQGTRHNIGFEVLAKLAARYGNGEPRSRFQGDVVEADLDRQRALLLCPTTYMNRSGSSVQAARQFYKLHESELLVVCDCMNLPTGKIRIRPDGSAGGQKGLADIIRCLGTDQFARLRIGIDRPLPRIDPADWVLGKIRAEERDILDEAVDRATQAVRDWAHEDIQTCMNRYN